MDGGLHEEEGLSVAVEVRIPTVLRKWTGQQAVVETEPGTISDVIEHLEERYPGMRAQLLTEDGELRRFVNVYVNDEDVRYLDKLQTRAQEGDTVSLLPSVAGGAPVA
jgi:molybdopterin synthase sulfur carrier subunit